MQAMLCSKGSVLGLYAYLGKVFYNACSVTVPSARMLQAMRCSNGPRKLFSLRHLLGRGFFVWRGRKFLFRCSLDVSLFGKQLVEFRSAL